MGQVWKASDSRLGRTVAVKILPDGSAREMRQRFEEEARAASALQHASIVSVYDVGTKGETPYIVTEFVDGETLRALLQRGPLPLKRVLDIATQIADGLAAAHAAGITHRDLKPENIMINAGGRAKILDFGLAKRIMAPMAHASPNNPTESFHSEPGLILGTANYMSPEQARGLAVDARSDQFSFGIVLYEMLSGRQPFRRDSGPQTLTAIIAEEPEALPAPVPAPLRWMVNRCLEKEPSQRYASTADLYRDLRTMRDHLTDLSTHPVIAQRPGAARRGWLPWTAAVAGVAAAGLALLMTARPSDDVDRVERVPLATEPAPETSPAFSPDGQSVAYSRSGDEIWVRSARGADAVMIARGAGGRPLWSRDGSRICYKNQREFWCVSAAGGTPRKLLSDAGLSAQFTPDGQGLLFIRPRPDGPPTLWVSSPLGEEPKQVDTITLPERADTLFSFSPDGTKLAVRNVAYEIYAIPYPNGTPSRIGAGNGFDWLADSRHGVLSAESEGFQAMHLIDTESAARRLLLRSASQFSASSVSPDGKRIVYSEGLADWDIMEHNMDGKRVKPLMATTVRELYPSWSPVEDRYAYVTFEGRFPAIWTRAANGSDGVLVQDTDTPLGPVSPAWSPDGRRIAYSLPNGIYTVRAGGGQPVRVTNATSPAGDICWSSDGESIWYTMRGQIMRVSGLGGEPVAAKAMNGPIIACAPDGSRIAYERRDGIHLMRPDGEEDTVLIPGPLGQGRIQFGNGGQLLYHLESARRELHTWDVASKKKIRTVVLDMPPGEMVNRFSVDTSGKRLLLQVGRVAYDLWTIENFAQPAPAWKRWFQHWEIPERAVSQRREIE